ncbi:hypothetical protein [Methanosarcina barkeri]|nr:hypothetical protein [Methanosarcina barkeri]
MKNIESINFCVESFIKYFGLPCANKKLYQSDNVVENSQDEYKQQLVFLFFKYKELQEEINISIPEYVTLLIKGVWSKSIYFKTTAQLIGFKTNLEKIKIHNFTIRLPTNEELNRIMNDHEWSFLNISYPSDIASHGINIIQDTHFWAFMETQQNRLENLDALYTVRSLYTHRELLYDEDNIKIIPEYKRLILALRLYNGNYTGIRSLFIKKLFIYEGDLFEPWREYPFLDAKFNDFRKNRFSLDLKRKEITSEDVTKINTVFSKLMLYEQNPLKQINKALDHFFQAFEQTYPVYTFTELIMAFETLFHKDKTTNTGTSINILNQLLPPEIRGKKVTKFFNNNNGCSQIRNCLLHGDINLDSAEIRKKIPDLEEYVRLALLKIIELRINDKLDCNEENYFEKLKEVSKVNVRG